MATKSSFLDKVYDVYENVDFSSYQQDNLNPVREIKPSTASKSNEDRARDIIASRFQEIQEELHNFGIIPEEEEEPITASSTGESLPEDKTTKELESFITAGTDPSSAFILGDPLSDTGINADPLALSIEKLIMEVTIRLNPSNPENLDGESDLEIPDLIGPPEVDCGDIAPNSSGDNKNNEDDDNKDSDNDGKNDDSGNGGDGDSGDDDDDDDDGDGDNNKDDNDPYGTDEALDKALMLEDARDAEEDATILQCAAVELGFLKVILTILRVVTILKKIVSYALNIAYTVIDIVQLAAGAWLNPTNIGKIIQRVIGRVMAIIQDLISMIIKMIWDLLNLDCLSAMTQGYIDQINAALAGINQLKASINVNGVSGSLKGLTDKTAEMVKAYEDSYAELKKAMASTDSEFSKLKNQYSVSAIMGQLKDAALDGLKDGWDSTGDEMVKNIRESSKEIAKNAKNIFAVNKPGVTVIGAETDSE